MKDFLKRDYYDDLSSFAEWFMVAHTLRVPYDVPLSFVEGVTGIVLYRRPPFQVQMFIVQPDVDIPDHHHPNVDSYEVFLNGMNFSYKGHWLIQNFGGECNDGLPEHYGVLLRVKSKDKHGAKSSREGGAFISIQKWLNGVEPTSVGNDWVGDTMGQNHTEQACQQLV